MPDQSVNIKESIRERYSRERDMSKVTVIPAKQEINLNDKSTRKRVVVYCRVSTDGIQQTTSFELQKNYYLKYVRQKPEWKLVAMYSDEGVTATSMEKRVGLLQMLADARAGKFDIIVVKNLSRLNRNLMDCMNIIYELRELPHPVGILFETENMFTLDKNIDFTLQVLSLVAQEESHKKSEAITSSYRQRFGSAQFMKPDLLGYDSVGVNEIAINEEEAKTVQLIFKMYLAGITTDTIAEVLIMLGRKTHTHRYKDGRVKEGKIKWSSSSVIDILKNERRCGDVLAQKTYTPNYLTHKSKKNNNVLPQYYAVEQHPGIIRREDFQLTQRIIKANRGGWKYGLPALGIYKTGPLAGFVSAVPNWLGFTAEDYNKACLNAYGYSDDELDSIYQEEEADSVCDETNQDTDFQYQLCIDSDDYVLFPETVNENSDEEENEDTGLSGLIHTVRRQVQQDNSESVSADTGYDLSDCEVVRPQFFNMREKIAVTVDKYGFYFNRVSGEAIGMREDDVEFIELAYNPVEQMIIVKKAESESEKAVKWAKYDEKIGALNLQKCTCKGITSAIYENMKWDRDYRYKLIGMKIECGGEAMLVFYLSEPQIVVTAKQSESRIEAEDSIDIYTDTYAEDPNNIARSRAIYYDDITGENRDNIISTETLGDKKYDPKTIKELLCKGIEPEDGWIYLKGMAVLKKTGFTIFPEEWSESFGPKLYERKDFVPPDSKAFASGPGDIDPYGWTLGLNLPSREEISRTIEELKLKG